MYLQQIKHDNSVALKHLSYSFSFFFIFFLSSNIANSQSELLKDNNKTTTQSNASEGTINNSESDKVVGTVYKVVGQMPRFPGCEERETNDEKRECASKFMLEYIYENLEYPAKAIQNETQGTVVLSFVVLDNGRLARLEILREIGDGCGEAALDVIRKMNKELLWIPGETKDGKVNVMKTLPIKFKL